jgi:lipoprotein-releasing system permease protein
MGWRYLRSQRGDYAGTISWVSVVGLALGVAALIVVISVMNGFDRELRARILGTVPHIVLYGPDESSVPPALREDPRITASFPFFEAEGMVARNGGVNAIAVYGLNSVGIDAIGIVRDHMLHGSLDQLTREPGSLVMGAPLARYLGLFIDDSVNLVLTTPTRSSIRPRLERFRLSGVFEIGAELDYGLVLVGLDEARQRDLASTGRFGTRLMLADPLSVAAVVGSIEPQLSADWSITDWRSSFGELFEAVRLEKAMMFVLLLLIVAVAAFNIVSAQTMLVHDKRSAIAILRTMGATDGTIMRLVLIQGMLVAVAGIGLGVLCGVGLSLTITDVVSLIENVLGVRLLDAFYLDQLPSRILASDIVTIVGMSLALCLVSALVPARRAAALNPADALHG